MKWSMFLDRLEIPEVSRVTRADYETMDNAMRLKTKDCGGYVGGCFVGDARKESEVINRGVIVLDLDAFSNMKELEGVWWDFTQFYPSAAAIHTTFSHKPEAPRARLIVPLSKPLTAKEYSKAARRLARELKLDDMADDTTYQASRMMFWPLVPRDGQRDYWAVNQDGPFMDPTTLMREVVEEEKAVKKEVQERPALRLRGREGQFCRAFNIHEAIEKFLSDTYVPAGKDRYRHVESGSAGGLVVYDNGNVAYSHHNHDPAKERALNSYQLVRRHKHGDSDEIINGWIENNNILPAIEGIELLKTNEDGKIISTSTNMKLIIQNDPELQGGLALDEFSDEIKILGDFPWAAFTDRATFTWSDKDDSGLRDYIENNYEIADRLKMQDALVLSAMKHKFHPIRDYIKAEKWDGIERANTLLIDFLNAEDTPYTRSVTRKALLGAVARVFKPGCKHDHVLVLVGPQGCRKSTTIARLGGKWYSDTMPTMIGKEAYEYIRGKWIVEMSEMVASRKAEAEAVKNFISKTSDYYRAAYDRHTVDRPRQAALFGTTNDDEFLSDATGNRRFWPVGVSAVSREKYDELDDAYVAQVWAEMYEAFVNGEEWWLDEEMEQKAKEVQDKYTAKSPLEGPIKHWLEQKVPERWEDMTIPERLSWYNSGLEEPTRIRKRVCIQEIWVEAIGGNAKDLSRTRSLEIGGILKKFKLWSHSQQARSSQYGSQKYFFYRGA
jgi:predicted P-loop ATPase